MNADRVLDPRESGLSEGKKVPARLNDAHVQVNPENDTLIFRSRCAARIPEPERPFHSVRRLRGLPSLLPIGKSRIRCLHHRWSSRGRCSVWIGFWPGTADTFRRSKTSVSVD